MAAAKCHLLALPAELQNYIYELTVVSDSPVHLSAAHVEPPLTRVNRQIRRGSLSTYYAMNVFECYFDPYGPNQDTIDKIASKATSLKRVDLHYCGHGNFYVLDVSEGLDQAQVTAVFQEHVGGYCLVREKSAEDATRVMHAEIVSHGQEFTSIKEALEKVFVVLYQGS